jgi:class 3 adenylate cyclase
MTRQTPLTRAGAFVGVLVSVVTVPEITRRIALVARDVGDPVFVLYERTQVVAHSRPLAGFTASAEQPLPTVAQAGDPILARIWDAGTPLGAQEQIQGVSGQRVATSDGVVVFLSRAVDTIGGRAYLVGTYHVGSFAANEFARVRGMAAAGLAVLLLSIVATIMIGRRISRPVRALAAGAAVVERQDFTAFRPLGRSRIREIDEAGHAFNQMVEGLKERERIRAMFGKYVPNEVVEQVLADPAVFALGGERRAISLLFTDITGFTTLAESMAPSAVLQLLNAYFEELCGAVEAQQGIVVDLIGDAVFAIFGAPTARPDHARRAIACAHDMDRRAAVFAAARRAEGIALGATRIGVHTGFATVGNVGSADRLKYSATGDIVNTTSRLEGANKYLGSHVMASREVVDAAGDRDWRPLAELIVKGRRAALAVVELLPPGVAAEPWVEDYRRAYAQLAAGSRDALAALRALAAARPDDPVIRFHRDRAEAGVLSVVVELTEK